MTFNTQGLPHSEENKQALCRCKAWTQNNGGREAEAGFTHPTSVALSVPGLAQPQAPPASVGPQQCRPIPAHCQGAGALPGPSPPSSPAAYLSQFSIGNSALSLGSPLLQTYDLWWH